MGDNGKPREVKVVLLGDTGTLKQIIQNWLFKSLFFRSWKIFISSQIRYK